MELLIEALEFNFDVVAFLALLAGLIGGYVKIMVKIRELEVRLTTMQDFERNINRKLDKISQDIMDLRLALKDKEDRS